MQRFKPTLTVIYLSNVDGCHSNFTSYLGSLHRADHGVGHIWDYIQNNIPQMANNTTMMVIPEHGRNLDSNNIISSLLIIYYFNLIYFYNNKFLFFSFLFF